MFRNLVPHHKLDACQRHFVDICDGKVDTGMMTIMKDGSLKKRSDVKGEYLINKIQDWLLDDVLFENYAVDDSIVKVIQNIVGPNVTAAHSMLINKPPDSTEGFSRHPMHQDLHYFPFRPADRIAASWTAMERIDEENGCLFAVPGSHKAGKLYQHDYPEDVENKAYHGVKGFDHIPRVNLIMEKGDTVFFHPMLLHGSGPNKTKGFRKAISVHYADTNCHFIDVRGTSQENIAVEVMELGQKKFGIKASFQDIWKGKSRLICGQPGAFQTFDSHL